VPRGRGRSTTGARHAGYPNPLAGFVKGGLFTGGIVKKPRPYWVAPPGAAGLGGTKLPMSSATFHVPSGCLRQMVT